MKAALAGRVVTVKWAEASVAMVGKSAVALVAAGHADPVVVILAGSTRRAWHKT